MASRPKVSDVKLPILKSENYAEWKIKMTSLLKARELYHMITGPPTKEDQDAEDYQQTNEETNTSRRLSKNST